MNDILHNIVARCKAVGDTRTPKGCEAITKAVERIKSQWKSEDAIQQRAASFIRGEYVRRKHFLRNYTKAIEELELWGRMQRTHAGTIFGQVVDTAFKNWVHDSTTIKVRGGNALCLLNARYVVAAINSAKLNVTHANVGVYAQTGSVYGYCDGVGYDTTDNRVVLIELKTRYGRTVTQHDVEWKLKYPVRRAYELQALGLSRMLEDAGGLAQLTVKTCVIVTCVDGCRVHWVSPKECTFNQSGAYWKSKKGAPVSDISTAAGKRTRKRKTLNGIVFLSYLEVEGQLKTDAPLRRVITKIGCAPSARASFAETWKRGAGGQKLVVRAADPDICIKVAQITHTAVTPHDILREVRNQKLYAIVYAYKQNPHVWRIMRI